MRLEIHCRQAGLSLVELLIGLFLSSLIITLLVGHYLATKRQYNYLQGRLEQALELQMAGALLRDSLRAAGFTPCLGLSALEAIDRRTKQGARKLVAVELGSPKEQWLQVNRMSAQFSKVKEQHGSKQFLLANKPNYQKGQAVLLADCYHAEVQEIEALSKTEQGQLVSLTKPLAFSYQPPIYLGEWLEERFFIQKNQQGRFALYYKHRHTEELSSQVNQLLAQLRLSHGKTLVCLKLGLVKSKSLDLDTEVRAG